MGEVFYQGISPIISVAQMGCDGITNYVPKGIPKDPMISKAIKEEVILYMS